MIFYFLVEFYIFPEMAYFKIFVNLFYFSDFSQTWSGNTACQFDQNNREIRTSFSSELILRKHFQDVGHKENEIIRQL